MARAPPYKRAGPQSRNNKPGPNAGHRLLHLSSRTREAQPQQHAVAPRRVKAFTNKDYFLFTYPSQLFSTHTTLAAHSHGQPHGGNTA